MSTLGEAAVAEARAWIGTPYIHQASCRGAGADCLGLVRGVWRALLGAEPVPVPPYTPDWSEARREDELWRAAETHLVRKPLTELAPGDVILFRMRDGAVAKHLGIAGEVSPTATFIHAYSGHGVLESHLTAPWRRRIVAAFSYPERRG